jgi:hypothetical protein
LSAQRYCGGWRVEGHGGSPRFSASCASHEGLTRITLHDPPSLHSRPGFRSLRQAGAAELGDALQAPTWPTGYGLFGPHRTMVHSSQCKPLSQLGLTTSCRPCDQTLDLVADATGQQLTPRSGHKPKTQARVAPHERRESGCRGLPWPFRRTRQRGGGARQAANVAGSVVLTGRAVIVSGAPQFLLPLLRGDFVNLPSDSRTPNPAPGRPR